MDNKLYHFLIFYRFNPKSLVYVCQGFIHRIRVSLVSVTPSNRLGLALNSSLDSIAFSVTLISLTTIHSPFALSCVYLRSSAVGSPNGKVMGVILMRCFIFHSRALFSGMFLTMAMSRLGWI